MRCARAFLVPPLALWVAASLALAGPARAETRTDGEPIELCFRAVGGCPGVADSRSSPERPWRRPNRLRNALELGLIIGVGTAWYWIDRERQVADWDYRGWKQRFRTDIYNKDHNPFVVNFSWHTYAGASFHVLGRINELGVLESAGMGLLASAVWEYGIEYREKISVNDMVFTTPAGLAIGEFVYWLGRHVQQRPGRGGEVARWTLGLPQTMHDALDRRRGARGPHVHHRFLLSSGMALADASRRDGEEASQATYLGHLRFSGELAAGDHHFAPGRGWSGFGDANFTSAEARLSAGPDGTGTHVLADTIVAGWHYRDIPGGPGASGQTLTLGTSLAIRYHRERYGPWYDRLGVAHLPGLAVDGGLYGERWQLRGKLRLHPDYAGVGAVSSARWHEMHPDEFGKTVLEREGYYYGLGASARLVAELSVPRVDVGAQLFYGRYASQQGLDRYQSELTVDQRASDRFADYELWLRGAVHGDLFVELRTSGHWRQAQLEELEARQRLLRHTLEVGTRF